MLRHRGIQLRSAGRLVKQVQRIGPNWHGCDLYRCRRSAARQQPAEHALGGHLLRSISGDTFGTAALGSAQGRTVVKESVACPR